MPMKMEQIVFQNVGIYKSDAGELPKRKQTFYKVADKSLAQPTSRCILFDDENVSFDASLVI